MTTFSHENLSSIAHIMKTIEEASLNSEMGGVMDITGRLKIKFRRHPLLGDCEGEIICEEKEDAEKGRYWTCQFKPITKYKDENNGSPQ